MILKSLAAWHREQPRAVQLVFVSVILASILLFRNHGMMGANWLYPYFSGAAHLDRLLHWRYSVEGYHAFRALPVTEAFRYDFSHEPVSDLRNYSYGNIGYVVAIAAAKMVLPFLSFINAIVVLQVLVHVAITLAVARMFEQQFQRWLFVLAYGANPLIVRVVTFPFYYFWQVVPAVFFLLLYRKARRHWVFVITMYATMYATYMIRPSILPILVFVACVALVMSAPQQRPLHLMLGGLLAVAVASSRQPGQPWDTAVVGLGGYDGKYVPAGLSDTSGYRVVRDRIHVVIGTDLPDGNFNNAEIRVTYYEALKNSYLNIVRTDPLYLAKNAALNFLQAFSVGYLGFSPLLWALSSLIGLVMIAVLIFTKQWLLIAAIVASSIGFVAYYPPIPAYMFGSYLLLVFAAIRALPRR